MSSQPLTIRLPNTLDYHPVLVSSDHDVPPSREELARAARSGSGWAVVQSVLSKVTSVGGQIMLGWLLVEGDLGLVATAMSVMALLLFFNPPLMADVLLQRKRRFAIDAPAAFWLTLAIAAVTSLVMAIAAPFIAAWYDAPQLTGLLLVAAMTPLGSAFQSAALARLRIDLRLGVIARWSIVLSIATTASSVVLAALGFGPYSIAIPATLITFVSSYAFIRKAGLAAGGRATRAADWMALFREYTSICAGQYAHTLSLFCDYLALSLFATTDELGIYYFAFRMSSQINGLLAYNVSLALQPVFSHLAHDANAQSAAFLKACRAIGIVAIPLCLLQAALSETGLRLFFQPRWLVAAPILALLSIAQAFFFTVGPTQAMLKAQSRFGSYVFWQGVQAAVLLPTLFLAAGVVGPWLEATWQIPNARALAVAGALVLVYAISCPAGVWFAIQGRGGSLRDVVAMFVVPICVGLPAAIVAWFVSQFAPPTRLGAGVAVGVASLLFVPLFLATLRLVSPELLTSIRSFIRRRGA